MRVRRWVTAGLLTVLSVGGLGLGAGIVFVGWLGTTSGNHWLKRTVETAVSTSMAEGGFEIGRLRTNGLWSLAVEDVRIVDGLGIPLLEIPSAQATYDVTSLLTGPLQVELLEVQGMRLLLDQGDARLRLAELFGPPSTSTEPFALPVDVDVETVVLAGTTVLADESFRLVGGDLRSGLSARGPVFRLPDAQLCAQLVVPGPLPICAAGPVTWDGEAATLGGLVVEAPGTALVASGKAGTDVDMGIEIGRLDLEALDPLASRTGLRGVLAGDVTLSGPLDALAIGAELAGVEGTQGAVIVAGRASIGEEITWGGTVTAADLDVAQLYATTPMPVVLDGVLELDGTGLSYPDGLELGLGYRGRVGVDGTYALRDTAMTGRLAGGVLTLTEGAFDGVAGPLNATGAIDLVNGPLELDVTGRLSSAQLAALGVTDLGPDGRVDLRVTSNLKQDDGRFRLGGTVRWAPFAYTDDVRIDQLVARVSGTTQGGDASVSLSLEGEGLDAYGVTAETLAADGLAVERTAAGLTVVGPVALTPLTLPGAGTFREATMEVDVALPTDDERVIDAAVQLGPFDLQTFLGSGGTARIGLVGDLASFDVDLDNGSFPFLDTRGTFDLSTQRLATNRFDLAPTARLAWTSSGPVELTLIDGGIADARIRLRGIHGDIDVLGTLATEGRVDGEVRAIGLELDALSELFPDSFDGLAGQLTLELAASGDAADPDLTGRYDLQGLWVSEAVRWLDAQGTFDAHDGALAVDADLGRVGESLGRVHGTIPMVLDLAAPGPDPDGPVDLEVSVYAGPLARLEDVAAAELGLPEGRISGTVGLTGALVDPDFTVTGIVETAVGNWRDPGRVEIDLARTGDTLGGRLDVREGLARRVRIDADGQTEASRVFASFFDRGEPVDTADLTVWWDDVTVMASTDRMPVASAVTAGGLDLPVDGVLTGVLHATGSPYTPVLDGEFRWSGGSVSDVPVEVADLLVRPAPDGGLELRLEADFSPTELLLVEGTLPVAIDLHADTSSWTDGPLDLHIDGNGIPLGLVGAVEGVSSVRGTVDVDGTVGGTFADPDLDLSGTVRNGRLDYEPLGLAMSRIEASFAGRGRRLKLSSLTARTLPLNPIGLLDENRASVLQVTGTASLDRGALDELSGVVHLGDAWVMGTYDTALRMSGDVRLSGRWPALNVDGSLELANGRYVYRADDAVVAAPLQPAEQLVIHRDGTSFAFRPPEEAPVYEAFDIDLDVDLKRNLEVVAVTPFFDDLGQLTASLTQANVTSRVGGELSVGLNDDTSWRVGGELDVLDGTIQVLRTKFRLNSGRVSLVPDEVGASPLDLSATSTLADATIDLRIGGTVDDPSLTATSEGHDETQVLVMLLTGRSVKGLTSNQGQAASQDAALAAAALITSSVFSGAAAGALSIEADGSVRVGAPWSSTVFSELVLRPFADADENRVSIAIEWALVRQLLLDAGAGDRYQWSDVSWETRF
jgi:hypothetical protein